MVKARRNFSRIGYPGRGNSNLEIAERLESLSQVKQGTYSRAYRMPEPRRAGQAIRDTKRRQHWHCPRVTSRWRASRQASEDQVPDQLKPSPLSPSYSKGRYELVLGCGEALANARLKARHHSLTLVLSRRLYRPACGRTQVASPGSAGWPRRHPRTSEAKVNSTKYTKVEPCDS